MPGLLWGQVPGLLKIEVVTVEYSIIITMSFLLQWLHSLVIALPIPHKYLIVVVFKARWKKQTKKNSTVIDGYCIFATVYLAWSGSWYFSGGNTGGDVL